MPAVIPRPFCIAAAAPVSQHRLATVHFGLGLPTSTDARDIQVPLTVLDGLTADYWLSALPVQHGWIDGLGYSENGEVLLGQVRIPDAAIAEHGMEQAAYDAYICIQQLMQSRGYPQTLRLWNFIPQILRGEGDAECYRQFNVGRAKALEHWPTAQQQLPAATAIGTPEGGLLIYVLAASRIAGAHTENPRQLPATQYPRQYGLKSPNFSRATRVDWADGSDLLVSGTASVVGHETRHPGDVLAQFDETIANLAHLVRHAAQLRGSGHYRPQGFKLYLKSPDQLALLRPRLEAAFGATPVTCLQGTICRHDLLVEVEGIYSLSP